MARRSKSPVRFNISAPSLPHAVFAGIHGMRECVHTAIAVQKALDEFAADHNELGFWEDMSSLGFNGDEICAMIAIPSAPLCVGYA